MIINNFSVRRIKGVSLSVTQSLREADAFTDYTHLKILYLSRLLLLGCFSYQKIKQGVLCVFRFMGLCTFSTKTRILYNSETLYLSMVVFHEMKKHALKNFY